GLAVLAEANSDPGVLTLWGRAYGSLLHLQLAADFFVFVFLALLTVWPKGGAVALAAFREGIRQPMFWLLTCAAAGLMLVSTLVPYFTMAAGEELKMVKELGYDTMMLGAGVFGVIS